MNALLEPWNTPFELPPFGQIKPSDYLPAMETALEAARADIAAIEANPDPASFENTIAALERSGALLDLVASAFFVVAGADTSDEIEAAQTRISPALAAFSAEVAASQPLYARMQAIDAEKSALSAEEKRVLELYLRDARRAGAALEPEDRARLKEIVSTLAGHYTAFSQNVLADERDWFLPLQPADLEGLPDALVAATEAAGAERQADGPVVTLSRSLAMPFLAASPKRALRETVYRAWAARGANDGPSDNRGIIAEILTLRHERAKLLGHDDFASYKLAPEMAGTPDAVATLLTDVWTKARARANDDAEVLAEFMRDDGLNGPLEAWDWLYYAEKRRRRDFDLDDAETKPYFVLDRVIAAAFDVAGRLFGLTFSPIDVPLYHGDARAWEVTRDGRHMGLFIGDYFARSSKRSGAWCTRLRDQSKLDGDVRPHVVNVCNFAKAPEGQPSLLTFDDARTLFHEFGHALHYLLSDVTYPHISGTSVARDFVELPSQLYEHWLTAPDIVATHLRHVETGDPLPPDMLERLQAAERADQGYATVEYTASALVDLDLHRGPPPKDAMARQSELLASLSMPAAIGMRHAIPHFQHVFSGDGYSSGYYSYMWSEVMDADAFAAFEESGDVFSPDLAKALETNIYAAGGSAPGDVLYTRFRGRMPTPAAMMHGRGFDA